MPAGRKAYIHMARGAISVNGQRLSAGDALKTDARTLDFTTGEGAEVLVFDLP